VQAEAPQAQVAPSQATASTEKVIISLSVSPRLAKQVRLLSKLEGRSISSIFIDRVAAEIPGRLKAALAEITEDA
jgi:hypothetical protein